MNRVKFGYQAQGDLWGMINCGIKAEKHGFDFIWVGDHFTFWFIEREYPETFTTLAVIGSNTRRIRIGCGVTDVFRRHPAILAQTIATLDVLTNGRANLGIGSGEAMNLTPFCIPFDKPLSRIRETISVIKMLWKASPSSPANFDGKFYKLREAFIQVKPVQKPHPPIYVAATGPIMRKMVGEVADGWFAHLHSPQTFGEALYEVRKGAENAGRNFEDIERVAFIPTSVSKNYEAARKAIQSAFPILALAKETLEQLGFSVDSPEWMTMKQIIINLDNVKLLREVSAKIPFEALEQVAAFGKPEHVIDKFEAFIKAGATQIDVLDFSQDKEEALELFEKEIIPYFKERYC